MEKEKIVPAEGREMNFFDLCVVCARAIGRGCEALWRLLAHMLRLSYRYWWLVLIVLVLAVTAAVYSTRKDNLTYKVNAIALLNGPTIQQFDQVFAPLKSEKMIPGEMAIAHYVADKHARGFETFRVIDCLHDNVPDYIDFKNRSTATDTTKVQMHDRLCIQFLLKSRDFILLPAIEEAVLDYLNADPVLQQAYKPYLANLQEEAAFNHRQAQKLDSLTSCYYYQSASTTMPGVYSGNGVAFYGERKIKLFLEDIYKQHEHMQRVDHRLQLATAPVTLENHFAIDQKPVNGRSKKLALYLLLGWCGACLLAEIIDKRKAICAWLKQ